MPEDLYVGALFPLMGAVKFLDTPVGAQLAFHIINNDPSLLPDYNLRLVSDTNIMNTLCNQRVAMSNILNQTITSASQYSPMVGILGAGCSGASMGAASVSAMLQIPQISHSSTSSTLSSDDLYPMFNRVIVSEAYGGAALANLLASLGVARVAVLFNTETYALSIFDSFVSTINGNNLDINYLAIPYPEIDSSLNDNFNLFLNDDGTLPPREDWDCSINSDEANCSLFETQLSARLQTFVEIFKNMEASHHKVFLVLANGAHDRLFIMEAAQLLNLNRDDNIFIMDGDATGTISWPSRTKSATTIELPQNLISYKPVVDNASGLLAAFETDFAYYDELDRLTPYRPPPFYSDENDLTKTYPDPPNKWAVYAYDAAFVLAHALHNVVEAGDDVTDGQAVNSAIRSVDMEGVTGRVKLEPNGDRMSDLEFNAFRGSNWIGLVSYDSAEGQVGSSLSTMFVSGVIPKDAYPPSTPVLSTSLVGSSLHVEWGDLETFSVDVESLSLEYQADGAAMTTLVVEADDDNLVELKLPKEPSESACARLTVVTRGGTATSSLTCDEVSPTDTTPFVVGGVVAALLFVLIVFVQRTRAKAAQSVLKRDLHVVEKQRDEAIDQLTLLQSYSKDEMAILHEEKSRFKKDMMSASNADLGEMKEMEKVIVEASAIKVQTKLGQGSFGDVFTAEYRGQVVAVKTMKQIDKDTLDRFRGEILIMLGLRHANVVMLVGACWEPSLMALIMEFCEKGMTSAVLRAQGSVMGWDDPILKWSTDIAMGMQYLHSVKWYDGRMGAAAEGIIHRDLKPDNCLVTSTFGIKIADFGESRALFSNDAAAMTQVGTPIFIAPEIVKGDPYSNRIDLYSYAMTILEFALKGSDSLSGWMVKVMDSETKKEATTAKDLKAERREARIAANQNPSARVTYMLIVKRWRPTKDALLRAGVPRSVADLITVMWSHDPDERGDFNAAVDYMQTVAKAEVLGAGKDGSRRASTSGTLALAIMKAQESQDISRMAGEVDKDKIISDLKKEIDKLEREMSTRHGAGMAGGVNNEISMVRIR
jgi:serine/threonine protein kinase